MSDAEIKSLLLLTVVAMLALGVRALWGKRAARPTAKNGWRRVENMNSGRFFDEQGAGGDPMAGGAD